ncbi:MAG: filamentous hemagglutinin N-terminal domain-containing protein, partial [Comamonadaceae bacterium]
MNTRIASPVRQLLACGLMACAAIATAQSNPTVVNGQATFARNGSVYSITNTPGTILQWPGFSIAAGDTTRFIQQSANSAVLNRITGQDPSLILGTLQSNGRVFLVNPNGVLFGAGARVDVNGLVASSLGISNADFLAGKLNFNAGAGAGSVANQGRISTPNGGRVLLIAPNVENSGLIQAPGGEVVLAAGRSVQLADSSNPELQVVVSAPQDQAVNLGQVLAQSGRVGIYGALVNQRGLVSADSATVGEGGKIVFKASGDLLLETGSQTSATGAGKGGAISLAGERVGLTGNAQVDASGQTGGGTVLAGNTAASQLFISKDSSIRADAIASGDGGKVLALSSGVTRVYGKLSARGGAASGNGGFIETSGQSLTMEGHADTRAPHGKTGKLLLDPTNIYIAADSATAEAAGMEAGSPGAEGASTFTANGPVRDSLMRVSTLETFLGFNDVTVSTANADGTGEGNINVVSPVNIPMLR